jgi:hypothetical protein
MCKILHIPLTGYGSGKRQLATGSNTSPSHDGTGTADGHENDPPEEGHWLSSGEHSFSKMSVLVFPGLGGQPICRLTLGTYDATTGRAATGRTATAGRATAGAAAAAGTAATVAIVPTIVVAVMVAILIVILVFVAVVAPAEPGPRMTFVLAGKG